MLTGLSPDNALPPGPLPVLPAVLILRGEDDLSCIELTGTTRPLEKEGRSMAWIYLVLAGALEIIWAFYMKKSAGFTLLVPSVITLVTMIASFALLSVSMRTLPLGTAYTVWTGIGAVGAFALGIVVLGEAVTLMRLAAAGLIVAGIVLMRFSTPLA